jgi:NADH-quinone oxidoreductase subunit L
MHHSLHELKDHDTDPQDMRNMGGFKSKMPLTHWTMLIATLAISGVPLFSGFLSKDAILAGTLAFAQQYPQHLLLPIFGFGAAAITAFYMFRLIFMTFYGKPKMKKVFKGIHESPRVMTFPLVLLAGLSFFIFYTLPYFNPFSDHGWFTELIKASDSAVPGNPSAKEIYQGVHHAHYTAMALSLLVAALGIGLSYLMYIKEKFSAEAWARRMGFFYKLSLNKYFFDENYNRFLYQPFLKLSRAVAYVDWDLYDKYFINGFGHVTKFLSKITGHLDYEGLDQTLVDGVGRRTQWFGEKLKQVQTGRLQNYMLFALIGVILILVYQAV